jgi:hypothetical protein
MSWCHYSVVDGEVCSGGGLLSSCRATTGVASVATTGGSVAAVLAVRWHCEAATPTAGTAWLLVCRDRPTLEREVASPSVPRSW